jgi:hypothetical protein
MPWFQSPNGRVWAGCHRVLGAVVFDPADQHEVPADRVRLFIAYDQSVSLLHKPTAHNCIASSGDESELAQAVETYCLRRLTSQRPRRSGQTQEAVRPSTARLVDSSRGAREPTNEQEVIEAEVPIPGICVWCRVAIPAERLQAVPDASMCVRCQAASEGQPSDPSLSGDFCPRCAARGLRSQLVWRRARDVEIRGEFLGCSRYPHCQYIARA